MTELEELRELEREYRCRHVDAESAIELLLMAEKIEAGSPFELNVNKTYQEPIFIIVKRGNGENFIQLPDEEVRAFLVKAMRTKAAVIRSRMLEDEEDESDD